MKLYTLTIVLFSFFILSACGVKGRPLPPLKPREMGYGKPQYEGANKAIDKNEESEEEKKKDDK